MKKAIAIASVAFLASGATSLPKVALYCKGSNLAQDITPTMLCQMLHDELRAVLPSLGVTQLIDDISSHDTVDKPIIILEITGPNGPLIEGKISMQRGSSLTSGVPVNNITVDREPGRKSYQILIGELVKLNKSLLGPNK